MIHQLSLFKSAVWKRVLVVAAHPDDETLATGGLLQRSIAAGGAVRVVFVTDGENNPWPQRLLERRWRLDSDARARWAERRRIETLEALDCLGVPASSAVFLHFPDQGLTSLLLAGGGRAVPALAAELRTWRPTLVAAPATADRHPDHNALAVLLRLAVDRLAGAHGEVFADRVHRPRRPPRRRLPASARTGRARQEVRGDPVSPEPARSSRDGASCHTQRRRVLRRPGHPEPGASRPRRRVRLGYALAPSGTARIARRRDSRHARRAHGGQSGLRRPLAIVQGGTAAVQGRAASRSDAGEAAGQVRGTAPLLRRGGVARDSPASPGGAAPRLPWLALAESQAMRSTVAIPRRS